MKSLDWCFWLCERYRSAYTVFVWIKQFDMKDETLWHQVLLLLCLAVSERERYRATISAPSNPDHPPSQHRGRQLLSLTTSSTRSDFYVFFLVPRIVDIFHLIKSSINNPPPTYPHRFLQNNTTLTNDRLLRRNHKIAYLFTWKW